MSKNEFKELFDLNVLFFNGTHDQVGRPLLILLTRNMNLQNVDVDHLKRFFCYQCDQICASMPEHVD